MSYIPLMSSNYAYLSNYIRFSLYNHLKPWNNF